MDDLGLKVFFLALSSMLISMVGIRIRAKKKQNEMLKDMQDKINSAASKVGAYLEQIKVFTVFPWGWMG